MGFPHLPWFVVSSKARRSTPESLKRRPISLFEVSGGFEVYASEVYARLRSLSVVLSSNCLSFFSSSRSSCAAGTSAGDINNVTGRR